LVGDLYSTRGAGIQDMGYTSEWDNIGYGPPAGWSEPGVVEVILDHTYTILTDDNHYAKMRVIDIDDDGMVRLQWAYQEDTGNPELAPPSGVSDSDVAAARPLTVQRTNTSR